MATSSSHPSTEPDFALLIIDVINALDFPEGEKMLRHALPMARRLRRFARKVRKRGLPVIYCNDNYGQWRSDFREVVARCTGEECRGAAVSKLLLPQRGDYLVLKPKHSAFRDTPLHLLLENLNVRRLILTGMAGDGCVLATAIDAKMREFEQIVPADGLACIDLARKRHALGILQDSLKIETPALRSITW